MEEGSRTLIFDGLEFDPANRQLRREGRPVELGSRYFDALALLLREPGALVTKDRFMDEVWRGIPVTDEALTQCIRSLRRALGERGGEARFIETVPKHGYRFVAKVEGAASTGSSPGPVVRKRGESRLAGASTIGGGAAGLVGGIVYGIAATQGGGGTVPVLIALGAALGVLGGAGVGFGMALAQAWRNDDRFALALGGAAGGTLVGALGQVLSLDGVALLTGASLGAVTGMLEGALVGLAAGVAMGVALRPARSRRTAVALAGLIGAAGGLVAGLIGGRLLAGSLYALQSRFPGSGLAVHRVGLPFGEPGYSEGVRVVTTTLEAAAFVAGVVAAYLFLPKR